MLVLCAARSGRKHALAPLGLDTPGSIWKPTASLCTAGYFRRNLRGSMGEQSGKHHITLTLRGRKVNAQKLSRGVVPDDPCLIIAGQTERRVGCASRSMGQFLQLLATGLPLVETNNCARQLHRILLTRSGSGPLILSATLQPASNVERLWIPQLFALELPVSPGSRRAVVSFQSF